LQRAAQSPLALYRQVSGFFVQHAEMQQENALLQRRQLTYAAALLRYRDLEQENLRLRNLLGAQARTPLKTRLASIIQMPRDPYQRTLTIDLGTSQGVRAGEPVIDELGLLGQVTRVYPYSSEVTLITDQDQPVPVMVQRNGLRAVVFGRGDSGVVDVRYLPHSADIKVGDTLVTSGIDGVYPQGLPVARVVNLDRSANHAFMQVKCVPLGGVDRYHQVLVVENAKLPKAPEPTATPPQPATHKAAKR
jgi:rod shape-determining protein MreC